MALLRKGSRGREVARVQDALNLSGVTNQPELVVDGIFGDNTHAAVIVFQHHSELAVDGIVGPNTMAALQPHFRPGGPRITPGGGVNRPGGQPPPSPPITGGGDVVNLVASAAMGALSAWRSSATFSLRVMGPSAIGGPGCVNGPAISGLILGAIAMGNLSAEDRRIAQAAAEGIGACMAAFQGSITVPGLSWYPAFAAFPGPQAPPMPNVPAPLAMLSNSAAVGPGSIIGAINNRLGGGEGGAKVAAIGAVVGAAYTAFAVGSQVRNVMGMGPVPSFAPPFVPVGPVVNGSTMQTGGHM